MNPVQVAVVGAGPAGLGAAIEAARAGAHVVLLDEGARLGGQLTYRLPLPSPEAESALPPLPTLASLVADAQDAGVDLRPASLVWSLFDTLLLAVANGDRAYDLTADRLIVATGSTDLPLPFPGASLPGVFTARALQILLNRDRVLPGRRLAVLGDGPEAAEVARDARLAGADIAILHPAPDPTAIVAEGRIGVEAITIDGQRHPVDTIAVAVGRQPDAALLLMTGRTMTWSPPRGGWLPLLDDRLRTDDPHLLCAGDAAGPCPPEMALAEGRYAGTSAAASLGLIDDAALAAAQAAYESAAPARLAQRRQPGPTYAQPDEWRPE